MLAEKYVRVMCDFFADGVWCSKGVCYSTDDLPISDELKEMIKEWQADYDANFNLEDESQYEIHDDHRNKIVRLMRKELPDWTIV